MKTTLLAVILLLYSASASGQATSSHAEIITVYSQNKMFYLKSIPYDSEFPSLRGKTSVYEKNNASPLYVFERGFDEADDNRLILSNNGEIIFYVIAWGANEEKEGLKSVTVYKRGAIIKSFTAAEITSCDDKRERCSLLYSNFEEVVDRQKSNAGMADYKKVFKAGVDEKEKFLSDYAIFSAGDTVYLTDSKRRVHQFDLKDGSYVRSDSFDDLFEQLKNKGRFNQVELADFDAPSFLDFPKLKNGKDTYESLAAYIGMKKVDVSETGHRQYKLYSFKMSSNISRDGSIEIEDSDFDAELPKEKIIEFFTLNKFDSSSIPKDFEKWHIGDEYFFFRTKDERIGRQEKRQEDAKRREELKKRIASETIEGVYIPQNLGECFIELDKQLKEVDKKEMQALTKRSGMISYHLSLGMWMRNNWGLWGGSRLQKYFADKGISHPEEMSSIILYHYHDWLNGKTETWKEWEKNPKIVE